MKCTGLHEAMKMIKYCRENGLQILLGSMAESSCGVTAMAQLMHYADYVDLDAPLLYKNDPFTGVIYEHGKIRVREVSGIGMVPIEDLWVTGSD
jgi:L-alanine-DL-glutamate epimerase-like enolase superfamily enzyme